MNELKRIFKSKKRKGIDIVVFLSGGKDSSYALYKIAKSVDDPKRILAVTMETGFLSDGAKENIARLKSRLGFKHQYWKINKKILSKLYNAVAGDNPRSICVGCNILYKRMEYETLSKYKPEFFATGNNSEENADFNNWVKDIKIKGYDSRKRVYYNRILKEIFNKNSREYGSLCCKKYRIPKKICIFDHETYDVNKIIKVLKSIGWKYPKDVIGTETDCIFTQAMAYQIIENGGRQSYIERIKNIKKGYNEEDCERALKRLKAYDPKLGKKLLNKTGYFKNKSEKNWYLDKAVKSLLPLR